MRLLTAELIIETIMAQHYDIAACRCWICLEGRAIGIRITDEAMERKRPHVTVD